MQMVVRFSPLEPYAGRRAAASFAASRSSEAGAGSVFAIGRDDRSAGRSLSDFQSWVEVFRGPQRPTDDLCEFLEERFGIKQSDLEGKAAEADVELRQAVQEV